jgi:hypothetical protein
MPRRGVDGSGWVVKPRPDRFTSVEETRYPLYRRLGGPRAGLDLYWDSIPGPSSP